MNPSTLTVKMILTAWDSHVIRTGTLLNSLTDEQLSKEIALGKNTGVYLLGHLIAVSDHMNEILGFGERAYADTELLSPSKLMR